MEEGSNPGTNLSSWRKALVLEGLTAHLTRAILAQSGWLWVRGGSRTSPERSCSVPLCLKRNRGTAQAWHSHSPAGSATPNPEGADSAAARSDHARRVPGDAVERQHVRRFRTWAQLGCEPAASGSG